MNATQFKTRGDATAAGWVSPRGVQERYRGFEIRARDLGINTSGYKFALIAIPKLPYEIEGAHWFFNQYFAVTRTVWLSEGKNMLGTAGSFIVRFHPQEFLEGMTAAKRAIDAFYESSDSARNWEASQELRIYEAAEATHQRQIKRAHRLLAKYGDRLSHEWRLLLEQTQ